jgi:flavin reductase (DIM6/NTAB) family NADH-FMN oxidoreductase RutF
MNFHISTPSVLSSHPTNDAPLPSDTRHLRNCLGTFATGVTVITARVPDGGFAGLTANSFSALSLDPALILWSLNRSARSLQVFLQASHFAINILSDHQSELARRFAQPHADRFAGVAVHPGLGGAPLIDQALGWLECTLRSHHEYGDHVLFIGQVQRCNRASGEPLLFSQGKFAISQPMDLAS